MSGQKVLQEPTEALVWKDQAPMPQFLYTQIDYSLDY